MGLIIKGAIPRVPAFSPRLSESFFGVSVLSHHTDFLAISVEEANLKKFQTNQQGPMAVNCKGACEVKERIAAIHFHPFSLCWNPNVAPGYLQEYVLEGVPTVVSPESNSKLWVCDSVTARDDCLKKSKKRWSEPMVPQALHVITSQQLGASKRRSC